MMEQTEQNADFATVEKAIHWLTDHYTEQPSLDELASELGMDSFKLQKLFSRWAGVSPKKFVQYLTLEHAKDCLAASDSVMEASFDAGMSGPGRLHDLFVTIEAMTPGEWKRPNNKVEISYGWHSSPFGNCLIAATDRGVCGLAFELGAGRRATEENLFAPWKGASLGEDRGATAVYADRAFAAGGDVPVMLHGTSFQLKVWEALLKIPPSKLVSYDGLARAIGKAGSARAVAGAVARNPVSWLVPCHRVIRATGVISGYRWGSPRKRAMLAWEAASAEPML
ncbi:MAG: 6-O-methylguanine DNA methyltransferase [Rhodospirillaceae bacterium]|nr:6-O-methylguanine DNA methyltransferase [Rhodospirillaceae bacterium]HAA92654.1 6-O-methylguanine DNA methyltransferase [Rhodospirillaceae bacterium]